MRMSRIALSLVSVVLVAAGTPAAQRRRIVARPCPPNRRGSYPGRAERGRAARRRDHRRQAVHVVHLSDHAQEADAVPAAKRRGTVVTRGFPLEPRKGSASTIPITSGCG